MLRNGLPGSDGHGHAMTGISIGVLGPLKVCGRGSVIAIRRGLPRVLMCSLVLQRDQTVSSHVLIDQLWGERIPAHPANALHTQVAYLRKALGGAAVAPIVTAPGGYVLDIPAELVDVCRFEAHRLQARLLSELGTHQALTEALDSHRAALDLWRGPAFFDVADLGFADLEIIRLEELRLLSHEELAETLLALGRASDAAAELSGLVAINPLRESLQELLILALYRTGRQSEALRAYGRAREVLAEELGVEPGPNLRKLERQVLAQDSQLDWQPPPGRIPARSAEDRRPDVPASGPNGVDGEPAVSAARSEMASPWDDELIGREPELERVTELLAQGRLLTLTGPGGAGKTRLALELASSPAAGPATVVDLAAAVGDGVGAAILAELGAPVAVAGDAAEAIVAALGGDRCLLVLDTCERVIDDLAPIVEALITSASNVTVLATSRRPLGVTGEIAWPVPPLAVPTEGNDPQLAPAFELFVRRARRVKPELSLAQEDIDAIAELCRALDGLPFAIELAAAQMDALSPATINSHLSGPSMLAVSSGPERQRTLSATTEWSVRLLDEPERDLLYRLAIFAPTFDLDAVVAISGCDAATAVELFVTLVRNSLVSRGDGERYRLLDTVRAYLQTTDDDQQRCSAARRLHAEHYASLAARAFDEIRTPVQAAWMPRLRADLANLRLALAWCFGPDGDEQLGAGLAGDIAWVWALQGNLSDARSALERACAVDASPMVRARVLLGIGLTAAPLGDHDRVRQVCAESAEIGRAMADDRTVADAQITLGVACWASGDLDAAAKSHDEGIALFDAVGERWGATICRILRSRTARDMGRLDLAEALLDVAIDDAKKTGDQHVIGLAYEQYGWLCTARGDNERAAIWATACLEQNEALGYTEGICAALRLLARTRLADGDGASARALSVRVLGMASSIGHVGATCGALECMAEIDASSGDNRHAAFLLVHAERARRHLPLPPPEAHRIGELRSRLQTELGTGWNDIETIAHLGSLSTLVGSILDTGRASGIDGEAVDPYLSTSNPASTQSSLPLA